MPTIPDTISAACELLAGKEPNFKLALWAAAMSPLQSLERNGKATRVLARYVHRPLPDRETLYRELLATRCNLMGTHLKAIYRIEAWVHQLEATNQVQDYMAIGATYADQCQWREEVLTHLSGYGMGRKTVSFAALILDPLNCQLIPIDRHVLARLGYDFNCIQPRNRDLYLRIERDIAEERNNAGYGHISLGLWHWYKWEEWRQLGQDSKATSGVESHRLLSCRAY